MQASAEMQSSTMTGHYGMTGCGTGNYRQDCTPQEEQNRRKRPEPDAGASAGDRTRHANDRPIRRAFGKTSEAKCSFDGLSQDEPLKKPTPGKSGVGSNTGPICFYTPENSPEKYRATPPIRPNLIDSTARLMPYPATCRTAESVYFTAIRTPDGPESAMNAPQRDDLAPPSL